MECKKHQYLCSCNNNVRLQSILHGSVGLLTSHHVEQNIMRDMKSVNVKLMLVILLVHLQQCKRDLATA